MRLWIPVALALSALPPSSVLERTGQPKVEVTLVHPPGLGLKVERPGFAPAAT